MYFRVSALLPVAALAAVAAAAPSALEARGGSSSECSTGPIQCCNSLQSVTSPAVTLLAGLLGIVLPVGPINVGLTCTEVASSATCQQQPVCCNGNNFNGFLVIGCSPINVNA